MSAKVRFAWVGLVLLLVGGAVLIFQRSSSAELYSGYGSLSSGPLTLDVSLVPPVAQPGERITLTARVAGTSGDVLNPDVSLKLPQGVAANAFDLPAGATLNLQDGTIKWTPSISPAKPSSELTLELTVQTVDVGRPDQPLKMALSEGGLIRQGEVLVWTGIPPIANAAPARQTVAVGQPAKLSAGVSGPGPITEMWDLGDGRRLSVNQPEVAFAVPGDYTVWVEASNPVGRVRRQVGVTVVASPVAGFEPDDDNPGVGQVVTFLSNSGGQPRLRITWEFGDGASTDNMPDAATHTYQSPGTYQVRQIVENDFGRSEAFWTISVGLAPVADMILPDRTSVGQPIEGQALGDASVSTYTWDMGDGREKQGSTVSHLYRLPGDYYVRLIAANDYSQTEVGHWVRVDPGVTTLYLPLMFFAAADAPPADSPLSADFPTGVIVDSPDIKLSGTYTVPTLSFPPGTTPAEQLFGYLNEVRSQFNLPSLAYTYELTLSAQGHVVDKSRLPDDPHTGTDGASPAERLLRAGYRGGYAGEATAWGFADARQAVEFWMNSEPHRVLLLNRNTNEVGIGYAEDYGTRNIWHWTADFGVSYGTPLTPAIRVQSPASGTMVADGDVINFTWLWPLPLASDQYFSVYVLKNDLAVLMGTVNQSVTGSRYMLSAEPTQRLAGLWAEDETLSNTQWFVRLEDGRGAQVSETAGRPIVVQRTLDLVPVDLTVSAPGTVVPLIVTETPVPSLTPVVTPTSVPPTSPPPPVDLPPVIITATPQP